MTLQRRFSAIRPLTLVFLLALLGLTGCAKVYDDTKGWGNDVEAWFRRDVIQGIKTSFENIDQEPGAAVAQAPAMAKPEGEDKPMMAPAATAGAPAASQEIEVASTAPEIPATTAKAKTQTAATAGHSAAKNIYPQTAGQPASKPAATPPTSPAKDQMAAKAGEMALHLSSNKTKKAAIQEWSQLKSAFPEQLERLKLEVARTDLGKKGVFYRVMAGPFPDKSAASQICAQLRKKDQYCAIMPAPKAPSISNS